jgi:hypothetical protein
MFQFLLGVLILASNFLGVSRAIAETGAGSGPGVMTLPIRGRARWAASSDLNSDIVDPGEIAINLVFDAWARWRASAILESVIW